MSVPGTTTDNAADKDEQKKLAAEKAAHDAQQATNDELSKLTNTKVDHDRKFTFWENILNNFTDKNTGGTDWVKILVTALGGIGLATFGSDMGPVGMLLMGAVGAVGSAIAGSLLVDWARGDNDPHKKFNPIISKHPNAPEANDKIIVHNSVTLPAVSSLRLAETTLDIPTYDPTQNPPALANIAAITRLKSEVDKGNPIRDATNKDSRPKLLQLMLSQQSNEMNLRYLRDELPKSMEEQSAKVDAYLSKLGPEAQHALSIKMPIDIKNVPGRYEKLSADLEAYGKTVKTQMLQELAQIRHVSVEQLDVESKTAINDSWDNLNIIAKRNIISNYASSMRQEALNYKTGESRDFFPEYEHKDFMGIPTPFYVNGHNFIPFENGNLEKMYDDALRRQDTSAQADILQRRLDVDKDMPEGQKLSEPLKQQMHIIILGLQADVKTKEMDKYMDETIGGHDIPALKKYEGEVIEYSKRVNALKGRMDGFAQSGSQLLILEEPAADHNHQVIKALDTRSANPQKVTIDIIFENGSSDKVQSIKINGVDKTAALPNHTLAADDTSRSKAFQALMASNTQLSSGDDAMRQISGNERGKITLAHSETELPPTASNAPVVWKNNETPAPGKKNNAASLPS